MATLSYSQSTGTVKNEAGVVIAVGWSGNGTGKNNPSMQHVHDVGPLPQGLYKIGPWEDVHPGLGPMVAHLEQIEGETFGRSAFYFHGPSMDPKHYGQESKGCIVIPRQGRERVKGAGADYLQVTA